MDRRTVLRAGAGLAGLAGLGGCLGASSGSGSGHAGLPADPHPDDGYPPAFETTPTPAGVESADFDTLTVESVEVPLVPVDVAYVWYRRGEARFADARGPAQFERSHVYGAVLSPAPEGGDDDPVADWPKSDRIVCYCGCPHHLSSLRAATLIGKGYERVGVVDEGFWAWADRGYPVAGTEVESRPVAYVVRGRTDSAFAGDTAWARHEPTGQREAAAIAADGEFALELHFADVTPASVVRVWTPGYTVEAPLGELASGVVGPPGEGSG